MTRLSTLQRILTGALLLGLCACGSSDDPAVGSAQAEAAAAATATAASRPATTEPADDTADSGSGTGSAPDVSQQLCDFLEQEVPRLEARGSAIGALAGFAGDYAGWVEKDADRTFVNAQELDKIATASCPEVREDVLSVLETPSFSVVLGS